MPAFVVLRGMERIKSSAALTLALMLAACGQSQSPQGGAEPFNALSNTDSQANVPAEAAPSTPTNAAEDATPNSTIPVLTPEAERGVKGARNFLLSFASAIEQKHFDQAWEMLSPGDQQKWSEQQFAAMFADLSSINVAIPTGTSEGAAGSIYYTAPITITGTDKDGRPVRIEGESVLRRVNDVDGATAAQLRWHFDHVSLDWTH